MNIYMSIQYNHRYPKPGWEPRVGDSASCGRPEGATGWTMMPKHVSNDPAQPGSLAGLWQKLTTPSASSEEDARLEQMTRVILLIMTGLMIIFTCIVGIGWLAEYFFFIDFAITLGVQFAFAVGLLITLRGEWKLGRYILPLIFFMLGVYGSINTGFLTTFILAYATTIVLSAMLMPQPITRAMVVLVISTHLILSQIAFPLKWGDFLASAIPFTSLIIGLSLLFSFAMLRLQTALFNSRDYAKKLISEVQVREQTQANLLIRNRELSLLNRVIASAASSLETVDILRTTLNELASGLDMDQAGAALLNRDQSLLEVVAEYPEGSLPSALGTKIPVAGNFSSQYVIENQKPLAINDVQLDPRVQVVSELLQQRKVASLLILPLIVHGQVLGTIGLDSFEKHEFSHEEIDLAWHAATASAQAIANAQLYAQVQQMAIHDDLTELLNRRGLVEFGQREFDRSRRFNRSLSVIFMDLDNFKEINDRFGHAGGDIFLRGLAKLLKDGVRDVDLVGRYGGDEFVMILPEADVNTAQDVAQRLQTLLETSKITIGSADTTTSTSMGIAEIDEVTSDLEKLIARADRALYQAKRSGRNQIAIASE